MIKYVEINGNLMNIQNPAEATLAGTHQAAISYDASLRNATPYLDGETVKFRFNAGTKGAAITRVTFGGQSANVGGDGANDPKAIIRAVAQNYPEYANASYNIVGDTLELYIGAGTKG